MRRYIMHRHILIIYKFLSVYSDIAQESNETVVGWWHQFYKNTENNNWNKTYHFRWSILLLVFKLDLCPGKNIKIEK